MRFLEGYSILYIQVSLAIGYPNGQGLECKSKVTN